MKMHKEDFNAGSPYSSWLKEELLGEVYNSSMGFKSRGLAEKHGYHADEETESVIMGIQKIDDLPDILKKIAEDIIRMELDENY